MQLTDLPVAHPRYGDAFNTPAAWLASPEHAFSSWIARQHYRKSSKTVLIAMFGKLSAHLRAKKLGLLEMSSHDLQHFLEQGQLKGNQRQRYIRMVERVFNHLGALGMTVASNPGKECAMRHLDQGPLNDPSRFLSKDERQRIIELVTFGTDKPGKDELRKDKNTDWQRVRDQALVAVLLGGGIKVGQARRLTVNCIDIEGGWIWVKGARRDRHRARLMPWACEVVSRWVETRTAVGVPGVWLFPSARKGRSKVLGLPMHQASIFRRTQIMIEAAGIRIGSRAEASRTPRMCAQTLRNSYAATLIDEGAQDALIAEYLGLGLIVSAQRMRAAYRGKPQAQQPSC